jgi:Diguanylate cyclase, GGDEF domain
MSLLCGAFIGVGIFLARTLQKKAKADSALRRLAQTDSLTGLGNRRTLDEFLEREWRRAVRTRQPLSLLFVDIDHFKAYNDRYGHQAGDEVLARVGRCPCRTCPPPRRSRRTLRGRGVRGGPDRHRQRRCVVRRRVAAQGRRRSRHRACGERARQYNRERWRCQLAGRGGRWLPVRRQGSRPGALSGKSDRQKCCLGDDTRRRVIAPPHETVFATRPARRSCCAPSRASPTLACSYARAEEAAYARRLAAKLRLLSPLDTLSPRPRPSMPIGRHRRRSRCGCFRGVSGSARARPQHRLHGRRPTAPRARGCCSP